MTEPGGEARQVSPRERWIWLAPALFGLAAVGFGQDANWDLRNYHWYNAWAWLHDRLPIDLAPAGAQSYLNPLLDLLYYGLASQLPPPAVAWLMGSLHGVNFVLLNAITRHLLPPATRASTVLLLSLAGCLGVTFWAGLGNTMGDNLTALFNLSALLLALQALPLLAQPDVAGRRRARRLAVLAGLTAGLGVGLKLSNGPYAVGLLLALSLIEWRRARSVRAAAALALATLAGTALTAGYWCVTLWQAFGNPLFPLFNGLFQSELAATVNLIDNRWHPRGMLEAALFPYLFAWTPQRLHEVLTMPWMWPLAYTLLLAWLGRTLLLRWRASPAARAEASATAPGFAARDRLLFLLCFVVVSYLVWMIVFSVGRYLVTIELMLPLLAWLALQQMGARQWARRLLAGALLLSVLASVLRIDPWGHAPFATRAFVVDVPNIAAPAQSTLLVLDAPVAWMLPQFPPALSFIGLGRFPESDGYRRRVAQMLAARPGEVFAIVPAAAPAPSDNLARLNEALAWAGVRRDGMSCTALHWLVARHPKYRALLHVAPAPPDRPGGVCAFPLPADVATDAVGDNAALTAAASTLVAPYGVQLRADDCTLHNAWIGARRYAWQFCRGQRQR